LLIYSRQSFGGDHTGGQGAHVLGLVQREPSSLTESAKLRFTAGLVSLGVIKQRRTSIAPAPAPVAGQVLSHESSLMTSPNLSHLNSSAGLSVAPSRKLSIASQNGVILNAAAAGIVSPFVSPRDRDPGKREANRRHSRENALSGDYSHLTAGAVGKIEEASSIEAWQNQGAGGSPGKRAAAAHAHGAGQSGENLVKRDL
jgi:hypothetical protein